MNKDNFFDSVSTLKGVGPQLSKYLKRQNWNINILQNPICLHICLTPKNVKYIDMLLLALKKFNEEPIRENNDEDITAIYGMAAEIPDKSIIKSLVNYYLDMVEFKKLQLKFC